MNFKRLLGAIGALLFGVCLVSCSGSVTDSDYNFQKDENTSGGFSFSSITINTDEVKKTFYIGDEFSYNGLKVKANYRKMVDGEWVSKEADLLTYSVDSSAFDSTAIGSYDIMVAYREGNVLSNVKYTVNVLPSIYDSLPVGSEYVSAIKAYYTGTNDFIKDQYVKDSFRISREQLDYKLVKNKIKEDRTTEVTEETISYMEINESNVTHNIDYEKVGSYAVKVTYEGKDLTIDGKTYKNKVTTFVILNVINPVKKIEKVSKDDTTFVTSASKPDYSNWTFKLTRHVDVGEEIVPYSTDLFKIDGVSLLITGEQTANVEYLGDYEGNSRPNISVKVNVASSSDLDIKIFADLIKMYKNDEEITIASSKTYDTGYDLSGNQGIIIADNFKAEAKKNSGHGLDFTVRATIQPQNKNSALHFVLDKPATVVIFVASTSNSDLVRSFVVKDEDGEEIASGVTSAYNTPKDRFEFKVTKAGTYTLSVPTGGIYFYGAIIAFEK